MTTRYSATVLSSLFANGSNGDGSLIGARGGAYQSQYSEQTRGPAPSAAAPADIDAARRFGDGFADSSGTSWARGARRCRCARWFPLHDGCPAFRNAACRSSWRSTRSACPNVSNSPRALTSARTHAALAISISCNTLAAPSAVRRQRRHPSNCRRGVGALARRTGIAVTSTQRHLKLSRLSAPACKPGARTDAGLRRGGRLQQPRFGGNQLKSIFTNSTARMVYAANCQTTRFKTSGG